MATSLQKRPAPSPGVARGRYRVLAGALAGLIAAATALALAELTAAVLGLSSSPVVVVGGEFIDMTPRWLKDFAIRTFGESDKLVLVGGILVTVAVLAAVVGAIASRRPVVGYVGVAVLGAAAAGAALLRPAAEPLDVVPSLVGALLGGLALNLLLQSMGPATAAADAPRASSAGADLPDAAGAPGAPDALDGRGAAVPGARPAAGESGIGARLRRGVGMIDRKGELDRRRFLLTALGTGGVAAVAGGVGRSALGRRLDVSASRADLVLPAPASPAAVLPAGTDLKIAELSSFHTPNRDFYRVDTALVVPQLPTDEWSLRIHGQVDREITIDFAQLIERDLIERDITLTCVSNEVGGKLLGNARWLGAPLQALLEEAGVQSGADQIVSKSVDGMTIGTPTAAVMDGRDAMLAIAMNGEPLPTEHGFPVRMLVPGLYGYVSACKWIVDMELTTFDAYDAYWVERGWAAQAAIKTSSRIDTPRPLANKAPGPVVVAGVAWAQHRGIEKVEVRVDAGAWQSAQLAPAGGIDVWRQWSFEWNAESPGQHRLEVRATDVDGVVQPEERVRPFPNGSTGWHSVVINIAA